MLATYFDASRSLVAASAFQAGEDAIAAGDAFDWRGRGLTELEAASMFGAGLLTFAPAAQAAATATTSSSSAKSQQPKRR